MSAMHRLLIAEDHHLLRCGLRSMLSALGEYEVVGEAKDGREACQLAISLVPDLVLTDLSMPGMNGIDMVATIKRRLPQVRVVVLTVYKAEEYVREALQVDGDGHSSTVTRGRLAGFGGAPNMGHDPRGRRHATPAWLDMTEPVTMLERGKKLVVQMVETFQEGGKPTFVDTLDAVAVAKQSGMPLAPIMIYGDDVTHLLTEDGIAYLYKARSLEERRAMIAAVAGVTSIGLRHDPSKTEQMRRDGLIALPEDLDVRRSDASRELLAAKSISDLVEWSGGLYEPPARFRSW